MRMRGGHTVTCPGMGRRRLSAHTGAGALGQDAGQGTAVNAEVPLHHDRRRQAGRQAGRQAAEHRR
jgi:hypothetical protein